MGFRRAIVPAGSDAVPSDSPLQVVQVREIKEAISAGFSAEP
jgi:hypothetical protein